MASFVSAARASNPHLPWRGSRICAGCVAAGALLMACGGKVIDSGANRDDGTGGGGAGPIAEPTSMPTVAPPPPTADPPPTTMRPPPPPPPTTTVDPPPPPPPPPPTSDPPPPDRPCQVEELGGAVGEAVFVGESFNYPASVQSCVGQGPEAVFRWFAPWAATFEFNTRGSTYDTVLALRNGGCEGAEVICNDDSIGVQSLLEWTFAGGEEVFIVVDSYTEFGGLFTLNIQQVGDVLDPASCSIVDLGGATGLVAQISLPPADYGLVNDCGGQGRSAIFGWRSPVTGTVDVHTAGSNFDTVLDVRESCESPAFVCNDDTTTVQSRLSVDVAEGQYIVIVVQAYAGSQSADENLQLWIEPAATTAP